MIAIPKDADVEQMVLFVKVPRDMCENRSLSVSEPNFSITHDSKEVTIYRFCDFVPKGSGMFVSIFLLAREAGTGAVDFKICGKGIYEFRKSLKIQGV